MTGNGSNGDQGSRQPSFPADPEVVAEARRLAAEDLGRDLHAIADILAEQGHHGPDGHPYPLWTMSNLLDDDLKRRRVEHRQVVMREAAADYNRLLNESWTFPEDADRLWVSLKLTDDAPGSAAPVEYQDFSACSEAVAMLYPAAGTAVEVLEDLEDAARALLRVVGPESILVRGCRVSRTECSDRTLVRGNASAGSDHPCIEQARQPMGCDVTSPLAVTLGRNERPLSG
ncbi:hypothetical protein [Dankookia sp. P2]|uniref:hypothetical protein n=1 Tax=Dankookia sp. P2 TaxID=3423955 RepID=UPI003D663FEA